MKKIMLKFLQLQAQMKILHWQTTSRAEHIAFGDFYDEADEIIDKIIENIQGKYGRIQLGGLDSIVISDYNTLKINIFVMDVCTFLDSEIFNCGIDRQKDAEINAIIDELRMEVNKLKYLMTLK